MRALTRLTSLLVTLCAVRAGAQDGQAPVRLSINGVDQGTAIVHLVAGDVWVQVGDLRAAGVARVEGRRERIAEEEHVSLRSLAPGLTYVLDEKTVELRLTVGRELLRVTTIELRQARPAGLVNQSNRSVFVNYAVNVRDLREVSGSGEIGLSLGRALGFSSFTAGADGRLDRGFTSVTVDDRRRLRRWVVGDSFAGGGDLGGGVLLGGVSVSRHFGLDPYFVRYPTLGYSGAASTPTTVEVYVNDALVRRERLPAGAFELRNLPVVAGKGSARLVLRDAFGRIEEVTLPVYFTPRLLAAGLTEYSYSAGFRRDPEGGAGSYGSPVFLGRHRIGFTDSLTAGFRIEGTRHLANIGGGFGTRLPVGELELAAAASRTAAASGASASLAYTYLGRPVNVGGFLRLQSSRYANLSLADDHERPRLDANLSASLAPHPRAGVTLQYGRSSAHDRTHRSRVSALANLRLLRRGNVVLSVSRVHEPGRRPALESFVGLNWALGRETSAGMSWRGDAGGSTFAFDVQKALPVGTGLGYRLRGETGNRDAVGSEIEYNGRFGRVEGEIDQLDGRTVSDLRVSGGMVGIGGRFYVTRPVQDAFAVVRVPGVPRVRAFASNQEIGRTDAKGDLLVPNLLSYYGNPLRIERQDVPIDHSMEADEKIIAPPFRGGAVVLFPVRRVQQVIGRLRVAIDGRDVVPASGQLGVDVGGTLAESPLGFDGEFYLENVPPGRHASRVEFESGTCRFELQVPRSDASVVDVGTVSCVTR